MMSSSNSDSSMDLASHRLEPPESVALQTAKGLADDFRRWELGRRKQIYALIPRAVDCFKKFESEVGGYEKLRQERFWAQSGHKPKKDLNVRDILYYLTGASSPSTKRIARKYASVVEHVIERRINDIGAYLEKVNGIEGALAERRKGKTGLEDKRLAKVNYTRYIKVAVSGATHMRIVNTMRNSKEKCEFQLSCRIDPKENGLTAFLTGTLVMGIRKAERKPTMTLAEKRQYKKDLEAAMVIERLLRGA